jgi:ribosomal protein S6--L-glutamate ligase
MRLISFDAFRGMHIPGIRTFKPEDWFARKNEVRESDWILFPAYWQVNTLVYGWKKKIFPSINSYHLGHNKIEMIRAFNAVRPDNTPFTRILPATDRAREQILDEFNFPFVAKDVLSSMGQGVYLIRNAKDFQAYARERETYYVQEYLPIQRDLRIIYVGESLVLGYWRTAPAGAFHNNISQGGTISYADVPQEALDLVAETAQAMGIDHAGFDVAEVDGQFYFLEFNVFFGGEALHRQGISLAPRIYNYLLAQSSNPEKPILPQTDKAA